MLKYIFKFNIFKTLVVLNNIPYPSFSCEDFYVSSLKQYLHQILQKYTFKKEKLYYRNIYNNQLYKITHLFL